MNVSIVVYRELHRLLGIYRRSSRIEQNICVFQEIGVHTTVTSHHLTRFSQTPSPKALDAIRRLGASGGDTGLRETER